MEWTNPEIIDELKNMVHRGMSGTEISAHYGVTRNSVIGAITRLRRKGEIPRTVARPPPPARPRTKSTLNGHKLTTKQPIVQPAWPTLDQFDARQAGCPLADLRHDQCRWPVTGHDVSPILFCEGTKIWGSSYCTFHAIVNKRLYKEKQHGRSPPPSYRRR